MSRVRKIMGAVPYAKIAVVGAVIRAVNRDLGSRYVVKELSRLPGLSSKMGQLLALKFGKTEWQEFAPEPVPLGWIKQRIQEQCPALDREIEWLDAEAHLASLGQVHRARLKGGQDVAIKVKYPQVDEEVENQIELVILAMANIPKNIGRTFALDQYEGFLREFFAAETDYVREADAQEAFSRIWADDPKIRIPKVFREFSTKSILTQTYESSTGLKDLWELPADSRRDCAIALTRFFIHSVFRTGRVHTDLHPKNWGFRPETSELVVYDFGATLRMTDPQRDALVSLVTSSELNEANCLQALLSVGFDAAKLKQLQSKLPDAMRAVFKPLREYPSFQFTHWNLQELIEQALGNDRWLFRAAGAPWFLFLMRSMRGWLYGMEGLKSNFNPRAVWPETLPPLPQDPWPNDNAPSSPGDRRNGQKVNEDPPARTLRVKVRDAQGTVVVDLTFQAHAVNYLEDLVPDEVRQSLEQRGIRLLELKDAALRHGLKPQQLFESTHDGKVISVWLEA